MFRVSTARVIGVNKVRVSSGHRVRVCRLGLELVTFLGLLELGLVGFLGY